MKIIICARQKTKAETLKNVLDISFQAEVQIWDAQEDWRETLSTDDSAAPDTPEKFLARRGLPSGPCIILQEVDLDNLRTDEIYEQGKGPLRFRRTVEKLRQELKDDRDTAAEFSPQLYADACNPIIYLSDQELPQRNRENTENILYFLDSSIWHRHVCVKGNLTPLISQIQEVATYWQDGRYHTYVALEFLDNSIRTFLNRRLADLSQLERTSSHMKYVSPFLFPSEGHCFINAEAHLKNVFPAKRGYLLVDDYAKNSLRPAGNRGGTQSKLYYIEKALANTGIQEICTATSINEAETKLSKRMYDVIFLDYLLGKIDGTENGTRELGIDLLNKMAKGELETNRGPLGQYWVFPVSVFSFAMESEIASGHVADIDLHYQLESGADPVCTPGLFRLKFLKFLRYQEKSTRDVFNDDLNSISQLREETAQTLHKQITIHQEKIATLLDDVLNRSELVSSLIQDRFFINMSGGFFRKIMPYLENYLRLFIYHFHHAKQPMLRDLEFIRYEAEKYNKNRETELDGLLDWVNRQRRELVSHLSNLRS